MGAIYASLDQWREWEVCGYLKKGDTVGKESKLGW